MLSSKMMLRARMFRLVLCVFVLLERRILHQRSIRRAFFSIDIYDIPHRAIPGRLGRGEHSGANSEGQRKRMIPEARTNSVRPTRQWPRAPNLFCLRKGSLLVCFLYGVYKGVVKKILSLFGPWETLCRCTADTEFIYSF